MNKTKQIIFMRVQRKCCKDYRRKITDLQEFNIVLVIIIIKEKI